MKSLPFYIPEAWKRYPFRAEPPRIGHYREFHSPPGNTCRRWELTGWTKDHRLYVLSKYILNKRKYRGTSQQSTCLRIESDLHFNWEKLLKGFRSEGTSPLLIFFFFLVLILFCLFCFFCYKRVNDAFSTDMRWHLPRLTRQWPFPQLFIFHVCKEPWYLLN